FLRSSAVLCGLCVHALRPRTWTARNARPQDRDVDETGEDQQAIEVLVEKPGQCGGTVENCGRSYFCGFVSPRDVGRRSRPTCDALFLRSSAVLCGLCVHALRPRTWTARNA